MSWRPGQAIHPDQSLQGQSILAAVGRQAEGAVHVRSAAEYVELLKKHAFENVEARRIPDDTPTPDDYQDEIL